MKETKINELIKDKKIIVNLLFNGLNYIKENLLNNDLTIGNETNLINDLKETFNDLLEAIKEYNNLRILKGFNEQEKEI